jgi:hypothetical protein
LIKIDSAGIFPLLLIHKQWKTSPLEQIRIKEKTPGGSLKYIRINAIFPTCKYIYIALNTSHVRLKTDRRRIFKQRTVEINIKNKQVPEQSKISFAQTNFIKDIPPVQSKKPGQNPLSPPGENIPRNGCHLVKYITFVSKL